MKELKFYLKYKCFPIWMYNKNGELLESDSPEKLRNNLYLDEKLVELQKEFDDLYVDNSKEFKYIGFEKKEDKDKFLAYSKLLYNQIKEYLGESYEFEFGVKIS